MSVFRCRHYYCTNVLLGHIRGISALCNVLGCILSLYVLYDQTCTHCVSWDCVNVLKSLNISARFSKRNFYLSEFLQIHQTQVPPFYVRNKPKHQHIKKKQYKSTQLDDTARVDLLDIFCSVSILVHMFQLLPHKPHTLFHSWFTSLITVCTGPETFRCTKIIYLLLL